LSCQAELVEAGAILNPPSTSSGWQLFNLCHKRFSIRGC